jgi:hypothetical protein
MQKLKTFIRRSIKRDYFSKGMQKLLACEQALITGTLFDWVNLEVFLHMTHDTKLFNQKTV